MFDGLLVDGREFGFGEECAERVLGADCRGSAVECFEGPVDIEGGVVPEDGTFSGRMIEVCGLVQDFGGIGEDEETVGKALGDPEELEIVAGRLSFQVKAGPSSKVGRVAAEVHSNVPDMSGENTDEFALGMAELVMQAAEDAFDREGLVVLDESGGKAN